MRENDVYLILPRFTSFYLDFSFSVLSVLDLSVYTTIIIYILNWSFCTTNIFVFAKWQIFKLDHLDILSAGHSVNFWIGQLGTRPPTQTFLPEGFVVGFWGVEGDVWRWLCRHLRRKNSAQTRERGLPSVLAEFIPSCWYIHHLNWDADLEKLRYKAGSLHQELLWHQNPVQLCPATTSVECYLCILCTFLWCYALGPLWWDVWPGL